MDIGSDDVPARPGDPRVERLAAEPLDEQDVALLEAIARAVEAVDPVPVGLAERAGFAVALGELEVEVASLQRPSAAADRDLAGVRSLEDHALTMTFTASAMALTVAVAETGRGLHRMDGWVTTDHPTTVTLRLGDDDSRQVVVEDGRFVFDDVPTGMVQVVVTSPSDDVATVVTPVFEL